MISSKPQATSATLAFDATGGGTLASQILNGMEEAANSTATEYSRYGSTVHKQAYIYGGLDTSPTILTRNFGMHGYWRVIPVPPERRRRGRSPSSGRLRSSPLCEYLHP
jgi:hypothetical protein